MIMNISGRFNFFIVFIFLLLGCGKESIYPEFESPPVDRKPSEIIQPGVTAFRIVAPKPEKRIFELDPYHSTPITIVGEKFGPVVVRLKLEIDSEGNAKIIYSNYPKESVGQDIEDIVKTWGKFMPYKKGIIKYLINIGGHEFKVDVSELHPLQAYIQDEIIDGALGKINSYFTNVNLNAKLDF